MEPKKVTKTVFFLNVFYFHLDSQKFTKKTFFVNYERKMFSIMSHFRSEKNFTYAMLYAVKDRKYTDCLLRFTKKETKINQAEKIKRYQLRQKLVYNSVNISTKKRVITKSKSDYNGKHDYTIDKWRLKK